ncbi:hypothetical protein [Brevundimonas mediterranea]|uniref:Uncharacterized protein n=1 Tax=Brevundimonas mediterranea TaxID=74329 RepID=A0A7W6F037_9CAUL|nr:hypothetical protein [Brevundimonas mediterranea]MBB3872007.1 hypothetical protein [Brevundimonas mediterranea]
MTNKSSDRPLMIVLGLGAVAAAISFVGIVALFGIAMFGVFFG